LILELHLQIVSIQILITYISLCSESIYLTIVIWVIIWNWAIRS